MEGFFVAGTDTGVGKTTVCAGLLKMLYGSKKVAYWKPVQTGVIVGDDTKDIHSITELPSEIFMEPGHRFAEPLAPEHAAKKRGKTIDIDELVKHFNEHSVKGTTYIVEGAGGVMVPYAPGKLQLHLMKALGLPVLLVAEDRVGAINHTLLSLHACEEWDVKVAGVILTKSVENYGNKESIENFGKVEVLAQLPPWEDSKTLLAQVSCNERLRDFFHLPRIPS